MPIQFGTHVALAPNSDGRIRAESLDRVERLDFPFAEVPSLPDGHWGRFVVGALALSAHWDPERRGVDFLVAGDIPGSGLSSSASLSVGLLAGLAAIANQAISGLDLARTAQRIEHEYIGVTCGLMDQAVIALGEPDAALLFDCALDEGRNVPIPTAGPALVVLDSGKHRSLAQSGYNRRHAETRTAAAAVGVSQQRLAWADAGMIARISDPIVRKRAAHVVAEHRRVDAAADALESRDWAMLGQLFSESHASLRDDFEVSCPELDALVEVCGTEVQCLGARMTGAGFGGAVVALFVRDGLDACLATVCSGYRHRTGLTARAFEVRSRGGVRRHG